MAKKQTNRTAIIDRIVAAWDRSRDEILGVGEQLIAAKAALEHGDFQAMIDAELPFSKQTANKLMTIAGDARIINAAPGRHLPVTWTVLYELTKIDNDEAFECAVLDGRIRSDMSRQDAERLRKEANAASAPEPEEFKGGTVKDLQDLVKAGEQFGVILADPPWPFDTWSDKGKDRSPENHYETMTVEAIAAMPVGDLAAKDCALVLWVTWPHLQSGLEVLEAWGFTYKTLAFAWVKQNKKGGGLFTGTGKWTRANTEIALLGTRGAPARLNGDVHQVIASPVMEHSRKPAEAHKRIERLVAGPYLELFARRTRPGWKTWGNQVPKPEIEK